MDSEPPAFTRTETSAKAGLRAEAPRRSEWREGGSNSVVESQPSKLLVAGSIPVSRSSLRQTSRCAHASDHASQRRVCPEMGCGLGSLTRAAGGGKPM